jgi:hypothetical protein
VFETVSCASTGNCSAGGYYVDAAGALQVFVVGQREGTWGTARKVPGMATLNKGGAAEFTAISCASPGNCSAGGSYASTRFKDQSFIVSQKNGKWGRAREVPGTSALNKGGNGGILALSCASAGNCSAVGAYGTAADAVEVFVATEKKGIWGPAQEAPGSAALNKGGFAELESVSCASAGNCSAGGSYEARDAHVEVFVISQQNGRWGRAEEVPGIAALNKGTPANLDTVSCGAPGNCGAGGSYKDGHRHLQAFVVNQSQRPRTGSQPGPSPFCRQLERVRVPRMVLGALVSVAVSLLGLIFAWLDIERDYVRLGPSDRTPAARGLPVGLLA